MYCKNCFKTISSRSQFCKYCGAPTDRENQDSKEETEKEDMKQEIEEKEKEPLSSEKEEPAEEQTEESGFKLRSEKDKEFPIPPRYIGIGIIVILLICIVVVVMNSSLFRSPSAMDYNDYVGVWQERAGEDVEKEGGVKLEILGIDGSTMKISMGFYDREGKRSIRVEEVGAALKDGAAYYTFSNDGYGNSGNGVLTFNGRDIEWKSTINKDKPAHYQVVKVSNSIPKKKKQQKVEKPSKETEETSENRTDEDYVLPNSDSEYLTTEDLEGMTPEELRIARNEILARHGRQFNDPALAAYFESKEWYSGDIDPDTFDSQTVSELNDFELKNIDLIQSME